MRPIFQTLQTSLATLALFTLAACETVHTPAAPRDRPIVTAIKPPSVYVDPTTGWMLAPTDGGMPIYTDADFAITYFPTDLLGAIIVQRPAAATGYLDGKVSAPAPATLYVALKTYINDKPRISKEQFTQFAKDGWVRVPGIFDTTHPLLKQWYWQVWAHNIDQGPITLSSKAIPQAGVFFIGHQRHLIAPAAGDRR